ncbi:MAG: PhnD/SsuA/transferrin family substrate-binding protein [Deltaproteobacteria bacterium]|nr:PhnD/SsuA/transferrin family substrate-binding protein [Deltaproteobacteria bacterium]
MVEALVIKLLICYVGAPGSTQQAQPVVNQFIARLEQAAGWPKGSVDSRFVVSPKQCDAAAAALKPMFVVMDLPSFLGRQRAWQLKALGHMGAADSQRYHVVVGPSGPAKVAALKGKQLVTTLAYAPEFVSRIVLGGKLAPKDLTLVASRRQLRGLRAVARGQAAATIVDDAAYRHIAELKLGVALKSIHKSPGLPGLILASRGRVEVRLLKAIAGAMPKLCKDEGAKVCLSFGVTSFIAAKPAVFAGLARHYR